MSYIAITKSFMYILLVCLGRCNKYHSQDDLHNRNEFSHIFGDWNWFLEALDSSCLKDVNLFSLSLHSHPSVFSSPVHIRIPVILD